MRTPLTILRGELEMMAPQRSKDAESLEMTGNSLEEIAIASGELPFVFDRFYRADKARRRATGGAGLGLSIVKSIAAAHDGRVWITSIEGKGTTLWVDFPIPAGAPEPRQKSNVAMAQNKR